MSQEFVLMAQIEVDAVQPGPRGFELTGRGADDADYRLEMHLELPTDSRTRTVLAELLAQSDFRLFRRVRAPLTGRRSHRTPRV